MSCWHKFSSSGTCICDQKWLSFFCQLKINWRTEREIQKNVLIPDSPRFVLYDVWYQWWLLQLLHHCRLCASEYDNGGNNGILWWGEVISCNSSLKNWFQFRTSIWLHHEIIWTMLLSNNRCMMGPELFRNLQVFSYGDWFNLTTVTLTHQTDYIVVWRTLNKIYW